MIVYISKNILNNKVYIGITSRNLEKRKYEHIYNAFYKLYNYSIRFYNSIRKYGSEAFEWKQLCECSSIDELLEKEKYYISLYDSTNPDKGYNMLSSSTFLNYKHSQDFKIEYSL